MINGNRGLTGLLRECAVRQQKDGKMENIWEIVSCPDFPVLDKNISSNNVSRLDFWNENTADSNATSNSELFGQSWNGTNEILNVNRTFACLEKPTGNTFKRVMTALNTYFTPVVIVIGATGNLLAFLVFTVTHLRRQSSSVYLASLALADMGFLVSLFIVWLSLLKIPLFHRHIWCQTVVYFTYVCTFLSVWYVVSFTVERYIIIWYPLRKDCFCTTRRARIVVITLALGACVLYSFATWTSGVNDILGVPVCMPFPRYYNFLTSVEGIDSAITLIFPSTIVIVLNIRIIIKIISVDRQRQPFIRHSSYNTRCQGPDVQDKGCCVHEPLPSSRIVHVKFRTQSGSSDRLSVAQVIGSNSSDHRRHSHSHSHSSEKGRYTNTLRTLAVPNLDKHKCTWTCQDALKALQFNTSEKRRDTEQKQPQFNTKQMDKSEVFRKCHARVHVRGHSQYRTARMLIIVSSVFVFLNLPSHVFRVHAFIQTSVTEQLDSRGHVYVTWHELFQLVYHLNFAINFFIYSVCGRQFRTGLSILYSRLAHRLSKWRQVILLKTNFTMDVV